MYKDKEKQKEATRERVRRYRERQQVTPESNALAQQQEPLSTAHIQGMQHDLLANTPYDIYSESRWKFLQSRGYIWDVSRQRAFKPDGTMGVTVPGDPAYESEPGVCRTCSDKTQIKSITNCHKCVEAA